MPCRNHWRIISLSAAVCVFAGCGKSDNQPEHAESRYFSTPFQEESQFIVETVVADIVEQIFFAKNHHLPSAKEFSVQATEKPGSSIDQPEYTIAIKLATAQPAIELSIKVDSPIWSAEVYRGVAAAVAKQVGLGAPEVHSPIDPEFLAALTDSQAKTIEEQNRKLSSALEADFTDPELHERAAALLGAFTLRDHSGDFFEIRSPLCRITAHLAIARLMRDDGALGQTGLTAEVMLFALMGNQSAALEKLGRLDNPDATTARWKRALQALITCDYRPLSQLTDLSSIERVAWFRAFAGSVDVDVGWNKLSDREKLQSDFSRIANERSCSVQIGHQLLQVSLQSEINEISEVGELSLDGKRTPQELVTRLNDLPERCFDSSGHVNVIGWGQWAFFFQRHLCHAVEKNFDFIQNSWGVPDEADEFKAKTEELFGHLRLYPFVRRFTCTDEKSYRKSVDDGFKETVAAPHLTPALCWNYLCYWVPFAKLYEPNPNPHINEWHKHNPLPGTAYDTRPRFHHPSLMGRPDAKACFLRLHECAPYEPTLSMQLIRALYHDKATYDQAHDLYEPILPYSVYAMAELAKLVVDDPSRYETLMANAASLDPDRFNTLGDYFRSRHEDDKAAAYFEKASSRFSEEVGNASYASWRIKYYLKKGDIEKARTIADAAGEVYSEAGLQAKAEFLDATGQFDEALEYYRKIEERYKESGALIGYCMNHRVKTGDTRFDSELQKHVGKIFPSGLERVGITSFVTSPKDGVLVAEENDLLRNAGMKREDIIVAVGGIRVHNFDQYSAARDFDSKEDLDLIVWTSPKYREIRCQLPDHRFGAKFVTYPLGP